MCTCTAGTLLCRALGWKHVRHSRPRTLPRACYFGDGLMLHIVNINQDSDLDNPGGRETLMVLLDIFINKFIEFDFLQLGSFGKSFTTQFKACLPLE